MGFHSIQLFTFLLLNIIFHIFIGYRYFLQLLCKNAYFILLRYYEFPRFIYSRIEYSLENYAKLKNAKKENALTNFSLEFFKLSHVYSLFFNYARCRCVLFIYKGVIVFLEKKETLEKFLCRRSVNSRLI